MPNAGKVREDDGGMSESLYLVSGRRPRFSLGCRPPTGSRISSPEVATRMRETDEVPSCAPQTVRRDVVRRFVSATMSSVDRIGLPRTVGGGRETSGRRRGRAGTAAAAPRPRPTVLRPTPNTRSVVVVFKKNFCFALSL